MANANLLITVHNSMLEREFEIDGVVQQLFRDRSGEMGEGTTLSLPSDSITHTDAADTLSELRGTTATELAWGTPTIMSAEKSDLTADTGYAFFEALSDSVRQTIRPDLLSESARQHGRLYANNLSTLCYSKMTGATIAAANTEEYTTTSRQLGQRRAPGKGAQGAGANPDADEPRGRAQDGPFCVDELRDACSSFSRGSAPTTSTFPAPSTTG